MHIYSTYQDLGALVPFLLMLTILEFHLFFYAQSFSPVMHHRNNNFLSKTWILQILYYRTILPNVFHFNNFSFKARC